MGDAGATRCTRCGEPLRACDAPVSFELPRCGVTASARVSARRCARCGEVRVADEDLARCKLAVARQLADEGVHTGEAVRHMRKALGLRACDLAHLLGVTPETISHWETDKAQPNRAAFVALAAMVEEALDGRATTRDRLAALAEGKPWPRALVVKKR